MCILFLARKNTSKFSIGSMFDQETFRAYKASGISERMLQSPYLRTEPIQTIAQYKEMQREWKNTVYVLYSLNTNLNSLLDKDRTLNYSSVQCFVVIL